MTLTMPELRPPTTCGAEACVHAMCLRWREQSAIRCSRCDGLIEKGQRFVEYRNPFTKSLVEQHHEVCPE